MLERAHIAGISKTTYVLATPRRLDSCQRNHHTRGENMSRKLWPLAALAMVALIGAGCSNDSDGTGTGNGELVAVEPLIVPEHEPAEPATEPAVAAQPQLSSSGSALGWAGGGLVTGIGVGEGAPPVSKVCPQHWTEPSTKSAHVWFQTAAIAVALLTPMTSTGVEVGRGLVVPFPNWPYTFHPQHLIPPLVVNAQV